MITKRDLDNWFKYHPPTTKQTRAYEEIRAAALTFATTVCDLTPVCPDQTTAVRKIREAVMTANAAIACGPEED